MIPVLIDPVQDVANDAPARSIGCCVYPPNPVAVELHIVEMAAFQFDPAIDELREADVSLRDRIDERL